MREILTIFKQRKYDGHSTGFKEMVDIHTGKKEATVRLNFSGGTPSAVQLLSLAMEESFQKTKNVLMGLRALLGRLPKKPATSTRTCQCLVSSVAILPRG